MNLSTLQGQVAHYRAVKERMNTARRVTPAMPAPATITTRRFIVSQPAPAFCVLPIDHPVIVRQRRPDREVIRLICAEIGVRPGAIMRTQSRKSAVALTRHYVTWRASIDMPEYPLPRLGRVFERDHTTVMNSLKRAREIIEQVGEDGFKERVLVAWERADKPERLEFLGKGEVP